MSRSRKKLDNRTLTLSFAQGDAKGLFIDLLKQAVKMSGLSIDQIADRVTRLSGRKMTVPMLNNYLGKSEVKEPYNLPAFQLRDFCKACGDYEPLFSMVRDCGFEVADQETLDYAQLGRNGLEKDRIEDEDRALQLRLNNSHGLNSHGLKKGGKRW